MVVSGRDTPYLPSSGTGAPLHENPLQSRCVHSEYDIVPYIIRDESIIGKMYYKSMRV